MPLSSYYTALTGLNSNSTAINVIGDNLANMNTTGFKAGQATFAELMAGASGTDASGNPVSVGLGSMVNGIIHNNSQGTINSTGNSTDAAINGNGYFIVDAGGELAYTRSGSFKLDSLGNLKSSDGFPVMGYMGVDGVVNTSGKLVPIIIHKGQIIPAGATANMSVSANINPQTPIDGTFSAPVQIYDSMGKAHTLTLAYTRTGPGAWSWIATLPAEEVGGMAGDLPVTVGSGDMTFDGQGVLSSPTDNPVITITGLSNGAGDQNITLDLFDKDGKALLTSYARDSAISNTSQDGFGASALSELSIDASGLIIGKTESGKTIDLAQLVVSDFPNVEGLQKFKGSTFLAFTSSGSPSIGIAGTGGRGTIVGSSLEQSNVDMAVEFVNLIKAQRAYQASSKIISTTDELYQDSLNLKR
jgi:flagellar hook protein FlgE